LITYEKAEVRNPEEEENRKKCAAIIQLHHDIHHSHHLAIAAFSKTSDLEVFQGGGVSRYERAASGLASIFPGVAGWSRDVIGVPGLG
jgi:hypothetical protein